MHFFMYQTKSKTIRQSLCANSTRGVVIIQRNLWCLVGSIALWDCRRSNGVLVRQKCARCESIKAEKAKDQIDQGACSTGNESGGERKEDKGE